MHDLRGGRDLVPIDSVGGSVLLVRANLHRGGLIFPPFYFGDAQPRVRRLSPHGSGEDGEIATEGLSLMAADIGIQYWAMPNSADLHFA
jgi:hypothetical protein